MRWGEEQKRAGGSEIRTPPVVTRRWKASEQCCGHTLSTVRNDVRLIYVPTKLESDPAVTGSEERQRRRLDMTSCRAAQWSISFPCMEEKHPCAYAYRYVPMLSRQYTDGPENPPSLPKISEDTNMHHPTDGAELFDGLDMVQQVSSVTRRAPKSDKAETVEGAGGVETKKDN